MQSKFPLQCKIQLRFGVAIAMLLAVGTISYRGMAVSDESDRWVRPTHEVIENLKDLAAAMETVESSYRGLVITGDENSLQSYSAAIARSQPAETNIRNLTLDNPIQQRRIPALVNLADRKVQYAGTVIRLRRTKGMDAAADFVREGGGQQIMDRFQ
jgi:CHASE3 domain sensor protein